MAISANRPKGRSVSDLRMVWRFALRYPGHIAIAALALLVAAAATSGIPYAFKLIIDKGFATGGNTRDIARWFEYLLMLVGVMAVATATRFYFVSWLGERTVADIRLAVHRNLLRLSPGFFEENRPAEITSRVTVDTTIIEQVVGTTVSVALRNVVLAFACMIILFALAPKLAGLILVGALMVVAPITILGQRVRKISRHSQDRIADVGAVNSEVLGAIRIVQAFNQEERERSRFADAVERVFGTAKRRIFLRAIMTAIVIFLMLGSITLIIWQGAIDVAAGRITGGTIAAFVLYGGLLAGAFGALSEVYGDLLRAAGASERLSELLDARPNIVAPADPVRLPDPPQGELTFDRVTFHYPTRPDTSALNDFSLVVKPRERLALVGPSGAGKTTIFQLAERFYDPQAGRVLLDGVDLRDADPADVRQRIAIVPQETIIFAATARDNLRYGNWNASEDDLWAAARDANAEEFLRALPEGLDTFMGEGGARLSGGQRQRIAIARALLRDAPLLLLDEATSALDAESERLVQDALDRLMAHRTTIVIAHRLATVRAAHRIVVMDQGQIVEEGTHSTLTARGGLYARLAKLQFEDRAA
ncbi:ABC transporter transmembrane domain-containing protein [Sphingomonas hankyongi]|uniref:ABC transporter transmembrane domain-containing protein n=1 Tax=Sphingomonas hankyongi TaxID=2908209 RepID=A0ABT0RYC1_9SPHN|nr:ABC transporter transmembrane domain-containing protein [Sphingomonas hankyongi]MCL6728609.1 ABC transporter transmembrane domain-containing protein [Sphingomonas hankyongi]